MVIEFVCPSHGVLVEFDAPGPSQPPETCWRPRLAGPAVLCGIACGRVLVRNEREA